MNLNGLIGPVSAVVMLIFLFMDNAYGLPGVLHGNNEIGVVVGTQTAIASGTNNIAKNRAGIVQGRARSVTINAVVGDQTTIAAGVGNEAQSNIGVARNVLGNTRINATVGNMSTIARGIYNTAETSIGVVENSGDAKVTVDISNVVNFVGGVGRKSCINIGSKGKNGCN